MKRTKLFGLLMAMIMGIGFTACEEDEANITITIDSTTPIPTEDVAVGSEIYLKYVVVSDNNIEEIRILENYTAIPNGIITDFTGKNSHNGVLSFETTEIKTLKFAIEAEDSKGNVEVYPFDINVVSAAGAINTYTAVLLGNQNSNEGSFYATSTNTVYKYTGADNAADNAAAIDLVYLLDGESNIIAAPSDAAVSAQYSLVADWSTQNETKLVITILSSDEFDAIDDDAVITDQTSVDLSVVSDLRVGDVVAFTTEAGKKGLFKVEAIANNNMTIEVKVQE